MITAQLESFEHRLDELKPLLPLHYEELALNKDEVPLDPQYDDYINREKAGELLFMTLRENGALMGYFIGFVSPGLHYKTCLTCIMDIMYVHPDHRGSGGGFVLFGAVEKELIRRGVQRWMCNTKLHQDISPFYDALGFDPVETIHSKWLGG